MNIRHFIFDLDGTLIDTEKAVLLTWKETLKEYGYDFTLDDMKVVLGVTTDIGLERLQVHVDENYVQKWKNNYGKYIFETDFFPQVKEMLLSLKNKGYSLGIVSSRSREEYEKYFQMFHLEDYFTTVVLEDDTIKHKPHPEPLYKYMELTHANTCECIYIGDMPSDIQCAFNANVLSGFITWNDSGMICSEAQMIFKQPLEICKLI